jgi:hypothetical protein
MDCLFLVAGALLVAFPRLLGWFVTLLLLRFLWSIARR